MGVVVRELGLEGGKAAPTPGTLEAQKAASVPAAALKVEVTDEAPQLSARDAKGYRGIAARCNLQAPPLPPTPQAFDESTIR